MRADGDREAPRLLMIDPHPPRCANGFPQLPRERWARECAALTCSSL